LKVLRNQELKPIPSQKIVKYTDMGNVKEVMYIEKLNRKGLDITKINKNQYMVNSTGEILDYKHSENRKDNVDSLRRTFKKIRYLINNNFGGMSNELAFTITYKENITDPKTLYNDFKNFSKRLKYKYPDMEYLCVVEPQGRGAWHCHVLLKFVSHQKIYIPNKEIAEIWGHGFVTVKAIRQDVDNLGAYLSAYLGDIELDDGENLKTLIDLGIIKSGKPIDIKEVEIEGVKKKFIKGGRLHMYPPGMNIYRKSKGILEPESVYKPYSDIKKIVGSSTPNYSSCISILDDDSKQLNTIIYEQYNMKRCSDTMENII
jgi:hypothetical protein